MLQMYLFMRYHTLKPQFVAHVWVGYIMRRTSNLLHLTIYAQSNYINKENATFYVHITTN